MLFTICGTARVNCMKLFHLRLRLYSSDFRDYYSILGLKPNASSTDIKNAYIDLSKKYHPDVSGSDDPQVRARFVDVTKAFSVLGKPGLRQEYDAKRKLYAFGQFGDGYRMIYPLPDTGLDPNALETFNEEMRK